MSESGVNKVPLGQDSLFDGLRMRMHWHGCGGEVGVNTVFIKSERNRWLNCGPVLSNSHQNIQSKQQCLAPLVLFSSL